MNLDGVQRSNDPIPDENYYLQQSLLRFFTFSDRLFDPDTILKILSIEEKNSMHMARSGEE